MIDSLRRCSRPLVLALLGATSWLGGACKACELTEPDLEDVIPNCGAILTETPVELVGTQLGGDHVKAYEILFGGEKGYVDFDSVKRKKGSGTTPSYSEAETVDVKFVKYCAKGGPHETILRDGFTFIDADPPNVHTVTPEEGCWKGGERVTIEGENFQEDTTIHFGAYPAANSLYLSETRMQALTPSVPAGTTVEVRAETLVGDCPLRGKRGPEFEFTQVCGEDPPLEAAEDPVEIDLTDPRVELEGPIVVEVGDVVGDSSRDVVAAGVGKVVVFRGDGRGGLEFDHGIGVGGTATDVALGDLNDDGFLDAAVTLQGADAVAVLLNEAGEGYEARGARSYDVGKGPIVVEIAELDRDAMETPDLIVACGEAGRLDVLSNDGEGVFTTTVTVSAPPPAGSGTSKAIVTAMTVADFDLDGRTDVVVGTDTTELVGFERRPTMETLLSTSSGGTFSGAWHSSPVRAMFPIRALAAADFAGDDGRPDVAAFTAGDIAASPSEEGSVVTLDLYTNVPVAGPFSGSARRRIPLDTKSEPVGMRIESFLGASGLDITLAFEDRVLQVLPYRTHDPDAGERVYGAGPVPTVHSMAAGRLDESDGGPTLDVVLGGGGEAKTIVIVRNDGSGFD